MTEKENTRQKKKKRKKEKRKPDSPSRSREGRAFLPVPASVVQSASPISTSYFLASFRLQVRSTSRFPSSVLPFFDLITHLNIHWRMDEAGNKRGFPLPLESSPLSSLSSSNVIKSTVKPRHATRGVEINRTNKSPSVPWCHPRPAANGPFRGRLYRTSI